MQQNIAFDEWMIIITEACGRMAFVGLEWERFTHLKARKVSRHYRLLRAYRAETPMPSIITYGTATTMLFSLRTSDF